MSEKEVKQLLKEKGLKWKDFIDFMFCQTVGINEDDSTNYYETDVNRFINNKTWKQYKQ
jgi:hypothetical protein